MRRFIAVTLAVLAFPLLTRAQPLVDRVPSDSLIYVGWQGIDSLGPAYDQSRMKAVLDSSNVPALINDFFPRLLDRIGQENRNIVPIVAKIGAIAGPIWRHPTAFYFRGVDLQGQPMPKLALIVQAGNESDALLKQFQELVAMAQGAPFPIKAFKLDNLVGIEVGFDQEALAVAGTGANQPKSIAISDNFKQAMSQVGKDSIFCAYVDAEGILTLVNGTVTQFAPPDVQQIWTKVRDNLGLAGAKRLAITCGFDGRDFSSQAFLAAPAPRRAAQPAGQQAPHG